MSRQRLTKPDTANETLALSPKQELAVDLLATGATVTAAAEASGVTRQTASEWLNAHAGFRAALNRRRQELWAESTDRLRALLPKALDVLGDELAGEKRLAAAVHVVRMAGLYGLPCPAGPTDPAELEAERTERQVGLLLRRGFG